MVKRARRGSNNDRTEQERLREHIADVRGHRNSELVAAIYAELAARPGWTFSDIVAVTSVGKSTLYSWWRGDSDIVFSAMRRLARDLHPEGELSDVRVWLMEGKDHMARLQHRLDQIECDRRRPAVVRETMAQLQREATAEGVVRFVSQLPEADREVVFRELAGHLARLGKSGEQEDA